MNNHETYIALFRGINVGGKNVVHMDKLKDMFEKLGFEAVKTYIQSGNVIFRSPVTSKAELTKRIAKAFTSKFHVSLPILLLTASDLSTIVANAPANFDIEPQKYKYDVWFIIPPLTPAELKAKLRLRIGVDTVCEGENVLYVSRITAMAAQSRLIKVTIFEEYQNITIRNWNTTTKLMDLINSKSYNAYIKESHNDSR